MPETNVEKIRARASYRKFKMIYNELPLKRKADKLKMLPYIFRVMDNEYAFKSQMNANFVKQSVEQLVVDLGASK